MNNANKHHFPHGDIMVVEDNKSDLKLLSGILREAGYKVRSASDGELALRSVQARLPALILLDIEMPGLDGYEVCRRLKDAKDTRDIPVIFISVRANSLDKVKAFGVGGVDYISKPFEPEEVLARVATHLALWKTQKEIKKKNLQLQQEIVERKRVEEETRQKTEDLVLINTINNAVNRGDSLPEILQLLARETKRIFSCYGATVYLLSEDREHLVMQTLTLPPAMISRVEKLIRMRIPAAISIPLKAGSLYRKVLQEGKPQLINDPKAIQGLIAEFTENKILKKLVPKIYLILGTRSVINVPLVSKGETIGLLDVSRKEPFTEFDLKRVETISRQLTSIIERKQTEERVKHLNLVLRAIRRVNQLIVREKDREKLLKGACENLIKTRGYHNAWIALLDEDGKLKTYTEAGLGKGFLPMVELLKRDKLTTCTQKALKQQEMVITENPESTCTDCPLAEKYSGRGAMTIRLEYNKKVYGIMSVSIPFHFINDKEEQELLKEVAGDIALGIGSIEMGKKLDKQTHDLQQSYQRTKRAMDATIETVSKIVEVKDPYTAGHQKRVSQLTTAIAKELNLSPDKIEGIRVASLIHDIGKISVPTEILSKPTKLSDIEFGLIKEHSQIGYDILKAIDFSYPVANIVLQHHEKINGSGYPGGLKGDEILLEAKIICVADVVEAMSSHRPYRPALGIDAALEEITQNKGTLYDSKVVEACVKLFRKKGFEFE